MTYSEYLLDQCRPIVREIKITEEALSMVMSPDSEQEIKIGLGYRRRHLAGLLQIAGKAGATDAQIQSVLGGKDDE